VGGLGVAIGWLYVTIGPINPSKSSDPATIAEFTKNPSFLAEFTKNPSFLAELGSVLVGVAFY
jgi:hypothetical protein